MLSCFSQLSHSDAFVRHIYYILLVTEEWKLTRKFRVLSFTNSVGGILAVGVGEPWASAEFARLVRDKVGPWLQSSLPTMSQLEVLLDSDKVLHSPEAKVTPRQRSPLVSSTKRLCPIAPIFRRT